MLPPKGPEPVERFDLSKVSLLLHKKKYFHLDLTKKKVLLGALISALGRRPEISFVYAHGSFLVDGPFQDLDLGVYLNTCLSSVLEWELLLEGQLALEMGPWPVDIRVLNGAPVSFRYWVIKTGEPILVRDPVVLADFVETTIRDYLEFARFRDEYLRETVGLGCQH